MPPEIMSQEEAQLLADALAEEVRQGGNLPSAIRQAELGEVKALQALIRWSRVFRHATVNEVPALKVRMWDMAEEVPGALKVEKVEPIDDFIAVQVTCREESYFIELPEVIEVQGKTCGKVGWSEHTQTATYQSNAIIAYPVGHHR